MKKMSPEVLQAVINDVAIRKALVYQNHEAFCRIYLGRHITHEFAYFHKEMFQITEKYEHKLNVFMAFRGSGKSTILNLSNVLYSIMGHHQKKFVLIMSKTRVQSQSHFDNIKCELEDNELLKSDLGPFQATKEDWGAYTIEIPKYGAKIMCIGALQNIRGLKYRNHRPDLIICDDIEDMTSFQDGKDIKLFHDWFMGEIWSIGDEKTNIVILGNLLHSQSILITLYKEIKNKRIPGIFRAYPLLDDRNRILWPAKYPNAKAIKDLERSVPGIDSSKLFTVFSREYLLDMSVITVDHFMEEKRLEPIRAGGKRAKDFEISAPMWGQGIIHFMYEHQDREFAMWFDDEDGYPHEQWKLLEAEYIKREKAKNPHFVYRFHNEKHLKNPYGDMKDYPDLPIRYRYWYKSTTIEKIPPSRWKKIYGKDIL